jgi:hypothetical protein
VYYVYIEGARLWLARRRSSPAHDGFTPAETPMALR